MKSLTLKPIDRIDGVVQLPGSKSISNRVLLLAALARGTTRVGNLLDSEDTRFMLDALRTLGIEITQAGATARIVGRDGPLVTEAVERELYLGMAGTAFRPLTAALCLGRGTFRLLGSERMAQRPIADLVDALRAIGASINYLGGDGFPPLEIHGTGLRGGPVTMRGNVSSQFLTSLMLAAPLAQAPVVVTIDGEQVSKPYLDLTIDLMRRFGVRARHDGYRRFEIPTGRYVSPGSIDVEGDASSATYFLAAAAIRGSITVRGIGDDTVQGDVAFVEVLRSMGADVRTFDDRVEVSSAPLRAIDVDLNATPDAAMTLAVLALFATGTTRIRNIANWRVKETDRLAAMATEL
ncbi:MAG TPA: 3-phosphoshikimate 1-carboxyvinyltransferase, partial [Pseudomonadales bacterium]